MKIWKKVLGGIIGVAILLLGIYSLFVFGGGSVNRGEESGLASGNVRNIVVFAVLGISAFITGFGFRDVVGRAAATHQRKRLAAAREQKQR